MKLDFSLQTSIMLDMHTPYTYRIGWSGTGIYYYGVRYAKDCHPDDLWVTYFTSSKHVKHYAEKHGDPDVLEIRRTFNSVEDAHEWEHQAIKRAGLVENKSYLNHTHNRAFKVAVFDRAKNFRNDDPTRKRFKDLPKERQEQIRRETSLRVIQQHKDGRANYTKPDDTSNYKQAALDRWADPEFKAKFVGQKWMNRNGTQKKVSPEEWSTYQKNGWTFGRGG